MIIDFSNPLFDQKWFSSWLTRPCIGKIGITTPVQTLNNQSPRVSNFHDKKKTAHWKSWFCTSLSKAATLRTFLKNCSKRRTFGLSCKEKKFPTYPFKSFPTHGVFRAGVECVMPCHNYMEKNIQSRILNWKIEEFFIFIHVMVHVIT